MNRQVGRTVSYLLSVALALLVALGSMSISLASGAAGAARELPARNPAQPVDAEYTAKIREYTTAPYFLTELVDHLPVKPGVPTPKDVLGYVIGTPERLTHTKDIYRYFRALAAASPRVRVWSNGRTEEGREMLLVAVTDEANLARLDRLKQITARLADPRKLSDAEAEQLIAEGLPIYWASGAIHSPETGSPEMLMELAYRLAVSEAPFFENIRKNVVFLITPVVEVDGRDRMVDLYNYRVANRDKPAPGLIYWGKYVAHDNNRDGIAMALELSRVMLRTFLDYHPQVLHDLHESVPYLYTSTGTGPYNAWLDPIVVSEWQALAYHEIEQMTKRGVPGVWTHGFYDGWAPNYMFYVANGHNSIGRFYETFGNGGADTRVRRLGPNQTNRTWFRPNPPLPKVKWSLRNNTNLMQSGVLFALQYVADHKQEFLRNFYEKSKRAVAKATTEGPAAWVIPAGQKRPALAAGLARLMQQQGAEVHRLNEDFEVNEERRAPRRGPAAEEPGGAQRGERRPEPAKRKLPAGSYVIRMDQPYSRIVDMLLDTQYYSTSDPRPYDDTGWTMGALRNVETIRVTDPAILSAPMTLIPGPLTYEGGVSGASATKFYLIGANAEPGLATLRFQLRDVKIFAAEEAFEADGKKFAAGSFVIPVEGNPAGLRQQLEAAAKRLGLAVQATSAEIKVAQHPVAVPRIALVHTWVNTQNEGWFRLALEEAQIPYEYVADTVLRETPNLRAKYDVIVYPPVTSNLATLIHGVRKRTLDDGSDFGGAIPWQNTPLTPNMGTSPDTAADIRGGLGFEGLANLKKFIEDGGVFLAITASASLPVELGLIEGVSIVETRQLQARGSVLNAVLEDKGSPIGYGYDEKVPVYFSQAPVFRVSLTGGGGFGGFGGGEQGGQRTSGRGSATDPDIPQGRPWTPPEPEPRLSQRQRELYVDPDLRSFLAGQILPERMWPRVVLRFARQNELWVSGMLAGAQELAETPAVVDVPLGRGHVVLFATNPMWRHETHGTWMLLLNAALHFDHLHVGREPIGPQDDDAAAEDGFEQVMQGHTHGPLQ